MSMPTLSVVMCSYNYGHLIGEALEAILSQSYRPTEIIVLDDASTDNSVSIIQNIARKHAEVRLLRNERNMGVVPAANKAFKYASGEYIYFAAADDRVLPGFFEKSMNLLAQYPQAGFCCSDYVILDEFGGKAVYNEKKLNINNSQRYFSPTEMIELIKQRDLAIAGQTIIMKKATVDEIGGFAPELGSLCDWFVDYVVGFRYGICYIPELLAVARVHNNSYSASGDRQFSKQKKIIQYMLGLLKSPVYTDVFDSFKSSGILSAFRLKILYMILKNSKEWDLLSFLLIRRAFRYEAARAVVSVTPEIVKRVYRRLQKRKWENAIS